jgi:2-haloacid dehalogenase
VASEVGSYKPAHGHWRAFYESSGAERDRHVHVAQSHFHDIAPANELGIASIWINRLAERHEPAPSRELPDLQGLADALDELVPSSAGQ